MNEIYVSSVSSVSMVHVEIRSNGGVHLDDQRVGQHICTPLICCKETEDVTNEDMYIYYPWQRVSARPSSDSFMNSYMSEFELKDI
jgi:hypothetical protein